MKQSGPSFKNNKYNNTYKNAKLNDLRVASLLLIDSRVFKVAESECHRTMYFLGWL